MNGDLSSVTETILLVDEDPVQYLFRDILERRGYRVLAASDDQAALRISHTFQGDIYVLLTE